MSMGSQVNEGVLEQVSALADGELDAVGVTAACARWRIDADMRSAWHAYHLIGDVLRSEDLALEPSREQAFIEALRSRLAHEPVVIAPERPRVAASEPEGVEPVRHADVRIQGNGAGRRWPLMASSAVAAGFVAVAGTYAFLRQGDIGSSAAPQLAAGPASAAAVVASARPAPSVIPVASPSVSEAGGAVVRDPRLDAYLSAHKQFAGTSALGVPSAFLRSATMESPGR